MRRLGCLIVLVILVVAAWIYRDSWLKIVPGAKHAPSTSTATESLWEPLTPEAAARGKRVLDALSSASGPVFANLRAAELASYALETGGLPLPTSSDSAEAAVIGDVLYVRALVPTKLIAGSGALGPLGGLLNEKERLTLGGSFHVIKPGLSEFQLRDIKLRDISVPRGAIPRIVQQIDKGKRTPGVSEDAFAVPTPKTLGDVRIANHRVTLYKTTQAVAP